MRDEKNPNTIVFAPRDDDPKWDTGPDFIVIDAEEPTKQYYYKFDPNNVMLFSYSYSDRTRYDYVYNGTFDNGTEIPVAVIATNNTNLTIGRRLVDVPPAVEPLLDVTFTNQHSVDQQAIHERRLGIENPLSCAAAAACMLCEIAYARYSSPLCDSVKKYTKGKFGIGITPKPLSDVCDTLNPCRYVCERLNLGGCATYICNGKKEICMDIMVPKTDCSITSDPNPHFGDPVRPHGGGVRPCPRCGFGDFSGISIAQADCIESRSRRRLEHSEFIPAHVTPYHRSLVNGCEECPLSDLKTAFREVDNRQDALLEMETALAACISDVQSAGGSSRSILPCIFRRTFELLDMMPKLSKVIKCQLSREQCYDSSDIMNSPGLGNLFIQAHRFESMVDLILLPYSGTLLGKAGDDDVFDATLLVAFGQAFVNALADTSLEGGYISDTELDGLLELGLDVPNEADVIQFALTWNQSFSFWNQGIFPAHDLPLNFSDPFFDIGRARSLASAFDVAKAGVQKENFAGFGDAWLTAVEAQQLEVAKQLAGVCASVRVRIEQELTLTRVGFEARLEISNNGDFSMENVTGEHDS
jgi:hypothetical protein